MFEKTPSKCSIAVKGKAASAPENKHDVAASRLKCSQRESSGGVVFTCLPLCLGCCVVKCARWCFYVQGSAQVFVGHRRLQARLHLVAIKLRESGSALRSSTAGSCFKAGPRYTN